ncbi:MAG: DoxX family protein [Coriobacteriia bacterium]|nr:DoxX family protein [Coriobacteriia bacterium]
MASLGLLILRLVIGLTLAAQGSQKLFGLFGGGGIAGTVVWFESLGMKPGKRYAVLAGLGELGSGLFFAFGLLTPLAAFGIVAVMIVCIFTALRKNGYWAVQGGYEYNVAIMAAAVCVALTGPGIYALDRLLGL